MFRLRLEFADFIDTELASFFIGSVVWFGLCPLGKPPIDDFRTVAHIKTLVHQLYSAMNIEQHQVEFNRSSMCI